jgi:nucleotide-binding universal stress UspA family protein
MLALEGRRHLGLLDCAVALARRSCIPLEIVAARMQLAPMVHLAPVDIGTLRKEIDDEADALLLEAIAAVPADVAVTGRLVAGRAWSEIQRIAALRPGELLAVRMAGPRGLRRIALRDASCARVIQL